MKFSDEPRSRSKTDKEKKCNTFESVNVRYKCRESTLNAFKSGIFSLKLTQKKGIKVLSSKQTLQWLSIAPAQVKAGNTSENLLNEISQIICSLYQAKEITKTVYNNIMNSIKV